MTKQAKVQVALPKPRVEIHSASGTVSAAAGGSGDTLLSPEQLAALQQTLTEFVTGFRPPGIHADDAGLRLGSLDVELSFKLETGSGSVLKLFLDASAEASIKAKVAWEMPK